MKLKNNLNFFLIIFIILFFVLVYFVGLKEGVTSNVIYSVEEEGSGSGTGGGSSGGGGSGGGGGSQGIIAALNSLGDIFSGESNDLESCSDRTLNQNEEGIDCGGVCEPCEGALGEEIESGKLKFTFDKLNIFLVIFGTIIIIFLIILLIIRKRNNLSTV
jgi:hypothetical protein